jgi:two-component system NtrC family sensor kinase
VSVTAVRRASAALIGALALTIASLLLQSYVIALIAAVIALLCSVIIAAGVIGRSTTDEEAERRARENELLLAIHQISAHQDDAREVTQRVSDQLQTFFGTSSVGIWLLDESGQFLEMTGATLPGDVPAEALAVTQQLFGRLPLDSPLPAAEAMRTRRRVRQRTDDPTLDPHARAVLESVNATTVLAIPIAAQDQPVGVLVLTSDTTRQLGSEEERLLEVAVDSIGATVQHLRIRSQQRRNQAELRILATAINEMPDAVLLVDAEGVVQLANPAIEHMCGQTPEEIIGQQFTFSSAEPEVDRALWTRFRDVGWSGERHMRHRNGTTVPVHVTSRPVFDSEGNIAAIAVLLRNLTDEKEQQRRLLETERLASLGELAAGVAHEVNNPLSAISNFAELLLMQQFPADVRDDLSAIASEAHRAGSIVRNLLAFARQDSAEREVVDVSVLARGVAELTRYQLRAADIALELELPQGAALTMADPKQVQQVLHNLVTNARQAIQKGDPSGIVTLRVTTTNAWVQLTIDDTGPGIAPDVLDRIFTPFFTTKPPGEGTGLGLSIVYGIVRENGGEVTAQNWGSPRVTGGNIGEGGARFIVRLPTARSTAATADATDPSADAGAPIGARCLIVEDEPLLAQSVEKFLRRVGYETRTVHRAEDALQAIENGEAFDVILTDLHMPGMGGEQFYERLRTSRPDLVNSIIFTSGDVASRDTHEFLQRSARPVLAKPYELPELKSIVDRVSAERRRATA